MSKKEKAISWAEQIANDNTHGYSQTVRWGPSYDCSSLVISAWQQAGVPVKDRGATFTGNMYEVFRVSGFADVTSVVNLYTGYGLERADVLLNNANHTAMYCGDGKVVHARSSEGTNDTRDNSGDEIRIQPYWNYPWDCVLRYKETSTSDTEDKVEDSGQKEEYIIPEPDIPDGVSELYDGTLVFTEPTTVDEPKEYSVVICRPGDFSWFVYAMQELLWQNGYYPQVDGKFGTLTLDWFIKFQRQHALDPIDGECGYDSWNELFNEITLYPSDKGYSVKAMQYLLRAQGHYIGDGDADGIFGPVTYKALTSFKTKRGLNPTAICDFETWNELIKK